ncbi:MAG: helix-turn-helix domain-containing protein [Proteobacteria bacterium]|nr:helix-turn-helix domain-containing protein [Pseudomonadota bacterium]
MQRDLLPVFLTAGETLYEPDRILDCAYFPATAIVADEYLMADGKSAEVAIVGSEGIVGIALFMGGESRPNRAVVQASGWAYRLKRQHLHEEFARGGALQHMLGVRRESVTEAAGNLQRLGLVRNSRGHITVVDRTGLESRSCECYRVVKREYDRLLPEVTMGAAAAD